jgi:hypothetical protein
MKTPPHVVTYRVITIVITLTIILVIGLGMAGLGPLGDVLGGHGTGLRI